MSCILLLIPVLSVIISSIQYSVPILYRMDVYSVHVSTYLLCSIGFLTAHTESEIQSNPIAFSSLDFPLLQYLFTSSATGCLPL
ncbi:hypothetical protein BDV38DRAFT_250268 [Aspergillus pseudotamarii]|uniref:Uncharacterized protein n=1 Tax=Aspergillus pseudotamarii TaxID=132259 RepID=A0A5N6SQP7_ASPPS|nr:uncharacterized protein BDV38DRAFT_250268 [Aspergillus pseudotamarii]KAE8136217.1 hypothetical protein BDV38DRAFT_250268 [Aspergillus pseudotamarii]